jgi:amino acid permease
MVVHLGTGGADSEEEGAEKWERGTCPATGKTYWYNPETDESTYEKPVCLNGPDRTNPSRVSATRRQQATERNGSVWSEGESAKERSWSRVTHKSLGCALALSLVIVVSSYLNFFSHTKADVLNNFPADDSAINFARLLLAFTMVFTYPMEQFVVRHALHALYVGARGDGTTEPRNTKAYRVITVSLFLSSLGIALLSPELGLVLELTGSVGASMIGYILPVACYFHVEGFDNVRRRAQGSFDPGSPFYRFSKVEQWRAVRDFVLPCFIFAFGAVCGLMGAYQSLF